MKTNEYGMRCYSNGETICYRGHHYKFIKTITNKPNGCDLYLEDLERIRGFCDGCGGCGGSLPKGTIRGTFRLLK